MNSDEEQQQGDGGSETGSGAATDPRLAALRKDLARLRPAGGSGGGGSRSGDMSGWGQAMKMGSEFIAGVVVGAVIGYSIDKLFGSAPWGMIVFLLLGFAAGTLNVMRSAGVVAEHQPPGADRKGKDER